VTYRTIVVGTDGSDRANRAVGEALALAKLTGATVHAVHMVHPAVSAGFADSRGTQLEVNAMQELAEETKTKVASMGEAEGVTVKVHTPGGGDAADALISAAEQVDADLVIVGNRGMSGMTRFVLGSVPNKVAHHCPCSVLIVNTDHA